MLFHSIILLSTENEKSKLISRLSNFTNPFIPPCVDQVIDVGRRCFDFANTRHVIAGNFLQNRMAYPNAIYGYNTGRAL